MIRCTTRPMPRCLPRSVASCAARRSTFRGTGFMHGFTVPVGTYRFKAGARHTVTISTTHADGNVLADGVAFVKVIDKTWRK